MSETKNLLTSIEHLLTQASRALALEGDADKARELITDSRHLVAAALESEGEEDEAELGRVKWLLPA